MTDLPKLQDVAFDPEDLNFVRVAAHKLRSRIIELTGSIGASVNGWVPKELEVANARLAELSSALHSPVSGDNTYIQTRVPINALPYLKLAIEEHLEGTLLMQEEAARLTYVVEAQTQHQMRYAAGERLLVRSDIANADTLPPLDLARFMNLEAAISLQSEDAKLLDRVFDDKFHTLMSQSLFLKDLRHFRTQCRLRGRPVSVAYIDIDNFKAFNTALTETQVDRDLLPHFMSALEAVVFGRGFAYREGGDEYLVILPGATHPEAALFFDSLREHLKSVQYPINQAGPTVSIGVCTAEATQRLTPLQIQGFANIAKNAAKRDGKDRVFGYRLGQLPSDESLTILPTGK